MSKSLVQQQFGAHAAAYATSAVHAKGASLARLVELVGPKPHWHALDVATGAGHTAAAFAPHVARAVASDLTPQMLAEAAKLAKARGLANMETAHADAEALPFADASFDLVTCRIAPHHFPDVARFVADVARVLKGGGTFALVDNIAPDALSTPGFSDAELAAAADAYNLFEKLRDPSHGRCLGMGEWSALMRSAGLDVHHTERLPKDMEFASWVERMSVDAATVARLRAMLDDGAPALKAFLKPRLEGADLVFTLDEAIRDPSHGRCLGMAEWTHILTKTGFHVEHKERLGKAMEFQPWAERLGADAQTIAGLRDMLTQGPPALKAFLKPHEEGGSLWFTLDEALVIARKS